MNLNSIKEEIIASLEKDRTFFKIDGLDDRYMINKSGAVFDFRFNRPVLIESENSKHLTVRLVQNGVRMKFRLAKLFLMCFNPLYTDIETYVNKLEVFSNPDDDYPINLKKHYWIIPAGGVECKYHPGFYSIQGNADICVSKTYEFIKVGSGNSVLVNNDTFGNTQYPRLTSGNRIINFPTSLTTNAVHRLICLAFAPLPKLEKLPRVDHLDADKGNYDISNLEWVTTQENNIRAIKMRLKEDVIPVFSYNVYTKKKTMYFSMQEAARCTGIHAHHIRESIDGYDKRYYPTVPLIFYELDKSFVYDGRVKRFTDKNTKDISRYFRVSDEEGNIDYCYARKGLAEILEIDPLDSELLERYITMDEVIIHGKKVQTVLKADIPVEYQSIKKKQRGGKPQYPIVVTNTATGETANYTCTDDFAALVGAQRKTIQRGVNQRGAWEGYIIEYVGKSKKTSPFSSNTDEK